ncbi:MAG: HNH endonuclease [Planctomycetaceae bacterium]|nr:HNH endonuclease [Planctomycetaceae bacterium]
MDPQLRLAVIRRAAGRCEYCRIHQDDDAFAFHVDHVVSQKHGGATAEDNLALACQNCNLHKGTDLTGVDPETGRYTRLFHPRTDLWDEHFRYAGARIEGLTDVGRTTVRVLSMNDSDRVEVRALLGYTDFFG